MNFSYSIEKKSGVNILTLTGELIEKNQSAEMTETVNLLIDKNDARFVLCLGDLKYVNSSGLSVLINILTRSRKSGGDVAIAGISGKVNELLIITKLNNIFNIKKSVEEAIQSLSAKS